jgi:transcriptional regulator with XRE-family HTH domain
MKMIPENIHEVIALNVRRLRKEKGFKIQETLATQSGVSRSQINQIERADGDTRISTLDKLANALDVSVSDLLTWEHR